MTSYTPAQLRALAWLPGDGRWRLAEMQINRELAHVHKQFPELLWVVKFPTGPDVARYRLTPAGIAERARLAKEGAIK